MSIPVEPVHGRPAGARHPSRTVITGAMTLLCLVAPPRAAFAHGEAPATPAKVTWEVQGSQIIWGGNGASAGTTADSIDSLSISGDDRDSAGGGHPKPAQKTRRRTPRMVSRPKPQRKANKLRTISEHFPNIYRTKSGQSPNRRRTFEWSSRACARVRLQNQNQSQNQSQNQIQILTLYKESDQILRV